VDEYRRFLAVGGPGAEPDPEIVRQLQNPGQKSQINSELPYQEQTALQQADYPTYRDTPRAGLDPEDRFQTLLDADGRNFWPMRMPFVSNEINLETGQPVLGAHSMPMFDIREEILIPRPGPRGIPPRLPGAGAEGNDYMTPLDRDQQINFRGVNNIASGLSGGASYDYSNSRFREHGPAKMLRPDHEQLWSNARNLRDLHVPGKLEGDRIKDVIPFNDPEGFSEFFKALMRLNMGHSN
jgi:hypothetical protein